MNQRSGWAMVMGLVLMGCGGEATIGQRNIALNGGASDTQLSVVEDPGDSVASCPAGARTCFDVTSLKNITHIFVALGFDACRPTAYVITVDGNVIAPEQLQAEGGPCNHSEDLIERDVWFPLPANQKTAEVCVSTAGAISASVSVGAKSAEECRAACTHRICSNCTILHDGVTH